MKNTRSAFSVRRLTLVALFGALAYVAMMAIHFKVQFLTFDVTDTAITLCGLCFGPLSALALSVLVPLLEMISVSDTGIYGFLMNALGSAAFSGITALVYRFKKSFLGAILGLLSGAVGMVAVMMLFNLFITPLYMGVTADVVKGMIPTLLLPFNAVKAALNTGLVLLLYKPVSSALRRVGVLPRSEHAYRFDRRSLIVTLVAVVLIAASLVIVFTVLGGSIGFGT